MSPSFIHMLIIEQQGRQALESQRVPLDKVLWSTDRSVFFQTRRVVLAGCINTFGREKAELA